MNIHQGDVGDHCTVFKMTALLKQQQNLLYCTAAWISFPGKIVILESAKLFS